MKACFKYPLTLILFLLLTTALNAQWIEVPDEDTGWVQTQVRHNADTMVLFERQMANDSTMEIRYKVLSRFGVRRFNPLQIHDVDSDKELLSNTICLYGNHAYVVAMTVQSQDTLIELYVHDRTTDSWAKRDRLDTFYRSNGLRVDHFQTQSFRVIQQYLYVFKLRNPANTEDHFATYDLSSNSWKSIHEVNSGGSVRDIEVFQGELYGVGALDSIDGNHVGPVFRVVEDSVISESSLDLPNWGPTWDIDFLLTGGGDLHLRFSSTGTLFYYDHHIFDGVNLEKINLNGLDFSPEMLMPFTYGNYRIGEDISQQVSFNRIGAMNRLLRPNQEENEWQVAENIQTHLLHVFFLRDTLYSISFEEWNGSKAYLIKKRAYGKLKKVAFNFILDSDASCSLTSGDTTLFSTVPVEIGRVGNRYFNRGGTAVAYVEGDSLPINIHINSNAIRFNQCQTPTWLDLKQKDSVEVDLFFSLKENSGIEAELYSDRGYRSRMGFVEEYKIRLQNITGIQKGPCKVHLEIPEDYQLFNSDHSIDSMGSRTYFWTLNMSGYEQDEIKLMLHAPVKESSMQDFVLRVDSACGPGVIDTVSYWLIGAYDPNDKSSNRSQLMDPNGANTINYVIRFQNTGNDTAVNVRIIDTLDNNLPINYIQILQASHAYQVRALPTHDNEHYILEFKFDRIMLPDSNVDVKGSNGFIRYKAVLSPRFSVGDSITNTAHIYFDYQQAIVTNTVMNKYKGNELSHADPESLNDDAGLLAYPNPNRGLLTLKNLSETDLKIQVLDMHGKPVREVELKAEETLVLNVQGLAKGMYMIRSTNNRIKTKRIILH